MFKEVPVSSITINRSSRQRRVVGPVQDLADSIKRIGLINPITVTKDLVLIAGERRLEACKLLSEDFQIQVRFFEDLAPIELQLLELEENLKRSDLSWQDQCKAISNLHSILSETRPDWTQGDTAKYLGYTQEFISKHISVASNLSDEKIAKAGDFSTAQNILRRDSQRAVENELNSMLEVSEPKEEQPKAKIFQENFLSWNNPGTRFNLIHCDFPYGIDHQKSEQGNIQGGSFSSYKDTKDTYWNLIKALCLKTDSIALPSAHLMFWFSMKFYHETISFIESNSNWELVTEHPLVWMKSDNKGIVSDVERRPRNIYETALLFSRGDRKIITPVSNAYACPTSKSFHASEKPEPMLRHFFRMFVDGYSEVLDPTCGSGTAVRAAFNLGAKRSLGFELDPDFARSADGELTRVKAMKQLERENDD